uniref:Enhancer of yellow 2 transcription factor homolog n=1 Tax=Strongyloides venezuelensis TaxID=75913 RepID=A0A0K0FYW3_STRVS
MNQTNFKSQEQIKNEYISSGEAEKIKKEVCRRLEETGYNDRIHQVCLEYIQKKGINNVSLTELFEDVGKDKRSAIDQNIQQEITKKIREFVENNITQSY